MGQAGEGREIDKGAAVTRSLLGYGVLSGVFYLTTGVVLGSTRDGFDFSTHPLSLLMLGDDGWLQQANLIITGAMVLAAAIGFIRALEDSPRAKRAGFWILGYGLCLIASGFFVPDPVSGFPPGSAEGEATVGGILHLAFGAIGFVSLIAGGLIIGRWHVREGRRGLGQYSRVSVLVIGVGFVAGAVLATSTAGVVLLWVGVLAGWLWLALTSIDLYKRVPHPDISRRTTSSTQSVE